MGLSTDQCYVCVVPTTPLSMSLPHPTVTPAYSPYRGLVRCRISRTFLPVESGCGHEYYSYYNEQLTTHTPESGHKHTRPRRTLSSPKV